MEEDSGSVRLDAVDVGGSLVRVSIGVVIFAANDEKLMRICECRSVKIVGPLVRGEYLVEFGYVPVGFDAEQVGGSGITGASLIGTVCSDGKYVLRLGNRDAKTIRCGQVCG